ncbi:6058_t:CDS:2, partial [Funneliformis mosseae]
KPARRIAPNFIPLEKDSKEVLSEVTIGILNTLSNSWENLAFGFEFVGSFNEGTYVINVIVPAIQITLKSLPFGKSSFINT